MTWAEARHLLQTRQDDPRYATDSSSPLENLQDFPGNQAFYITLLLMLISLVLFSLFKAAYQADMVRRRPGRRKRHSSGRRRSKRHASSGRRRTA